MMDTEQYYMFLALLFIIMLTIYSVFKIAYITSEQKEIEKNIKEIKSLLIEADDKQHRVVGIIESFLEVLKESDIQTNKHLLDIFGSLTELSNILVSKEKAKNNIADDFIDFLKKINKETNDESDDKIDLFVQNKPNKGKSNIGLIDKNHIHMTFLKEDSSMLEIFIKDLNNQLQRSILGKEVFLTNQEEYYVHETLNPLFDDTVIHLCLRKRPKQASKKAKNPIVN